MIEVDALDKAYGAVHAVQGLSFTVRKGEILVRVIDIAAHDYRRR